jgi:hypothetical protein
MVVPYSTTAGAWWAGLVAARVRYGSSRLQHVVADEGELDYSGLVS